MTLEICLPELLLWSITDNNISNNVWPSNLSDPACQIHKSCRQDFTHVALPVNINPQAGFLFFQCIANILQHILSAFFIGV